MYSFRGMSSGDADLRQNTSRNKKKGNVEWLTEIELNTVGSVANNCTRKMVGRQENKNRHKGSGLWDSEID